MGSKMESTRGVLEPKMFGCYSVFGFLNWFLKWVLKLHLPLLRKSLKIIKKILVDAIALQKRWKNMNPKKIDRHEANQTKHWKEHSMIPQSIFQWVAATDGLMISCLPSQVFSRNLCFRSCQTIRVHPNPNAFRMYPKLPLFKWI